MRRRSKVAERIELPGVVDAETGRRLRARADIFTAHNCVGPLTRQEESFGVSVLEAMASGRPVVTGRSGGVCENIVDGETGYLLTPGDVEAHAAALLRLGRDPELRRRMGMAGYRRVQAEYSCMERWGEFRRTLGLGKPESCGVRTREPGTPAPAHA